MGTLLLVIMLALACQAGNCNQHFVNVKDFGAIGDGKADDSDAIQAALDKAKSGPRGTYVVLPAGEYRVTKPLKIEAVLLRGLEAGGWCADVYPMPTLKVDFTEGPCIIAGAGASIHGINFDHNHQGKDDRQFGPTILLTGIGVSITNVRIHQPTEGIMADGVSNLGRLNLENVFIINARKCGVYVTNTYDIATLRSVEVWNLSDYCQHRSVGFKFGKNDEIRIEHCFAFKCRTGYLFTKEKDGSTWGGMTGSTADFSMEGILIESVDSLRIVGGSLWCHGTSLKIVGPGKVIVSGTDMKANLEPALVVKDCDSLTVTGCSFGKAGNNWPHVFAVTLEGGKNVLINACTFDANGPGILIGESMDSFSITNNLFQDSPYEYIVDKSAESSKKIVQANLFRRTCEAEAK